MSSFESYWDDRFNRYIGLLKEKSVDESAGAVTVSATRCLMSFLELQGKRKPMPVSKLMKSVRELPLQNLPDSQKYILLSIIIRSLTTLGLVHQALKYSFEHQAPDKEVETSSEALIARLQGDLLRQAGHHEEAWKCQQNALRIFSKNKNSVNEAHCLNNLGLILMDQGNIIKAEKYFSESLALLNRSLKVCRVNPLLTGHLHNNLGIIDSIQGKFDSAASHLMRSINYREKVHDWPGIAESSYNSALIFIKKKDYDAAVSLLDKSAAIAQKIGINLLVAHQLVARSEIYMEKDDFKPAEYCLKNAQKIYKEQDFLLGIAEVMKVEGMLLMRRKNMRQAKALLLKALRHYQDANFQMGSAQTKELLAEIHLENSDGRKAKKLMKEAVEVFQVLNAAEEVRRLRTRLKNVTD